VTVEGSYNFERGAEVSLPNDLKCDILNGIPGDSNEHFAASFNVPATKILSTFTPIAPWDRLIHPFPLGSRRNQGALLIGNKFSRKRRKFHV
jgi:hypothetical protein